MTSLPEINIQDHSLFKSLLFSLGEVILLAHVLCSKNSPVTMRSHRICDAESNELLLLFFVFSDLFLA